MEFIPGKNEVGIKICHLYKIVWLGIIFSFLSGSYINDVTAQCTTSGSIPIPDNDSISVHFIVSGLADNDLGSPTQGICGIDLNFVHEYLGDLTFTLISPSGHSIELIGPTTTAIPTTNLSRWNIHFIPCMDAAMPDPGFTPTWSNLQPWQFFTPYNGTYHPYLGCLEDFNSGPANGVWQLIIKDGDVLQTGVLDNATLLFCNPTGLLCEPCDPNAGILTPGVISKCVGQNISSADIQIDFGGNPPSSSYSYQFLMTAGNSIIRSGSFFSDTPPSGNYNICGISYLTVDSSQINNLLAAGDYNLLLQALNAGLVCAEISTQCVSLEVLPVPDTTLINGIICPNGSFVFRGQTFPNPGIYFVSIDGVGLCDSVFRLDLNADNLIAIISTPDSIGCDGSGVLLDGSASNGGIGPISYQWSTETGVIAGAINTNKATALAPGTYKLTIMDGSCEASSEVNVYGNGNFPRIFAEGGEISCRQPSFTIHPVVVPSNVTFSWTGPGGFTSAMKDITVTIPGQYLLQVESASGCVAFSYINVKGNFTTPDPSIFLAAKYCENNSAIIASVTPTAIYEWSGPGEPFLHDIGIFIFLPGDYSLTVTDPGNGCSASSTFAYDGDYQIPQISVSGVDSLRCNEEVSVTIDPINLIPYPHWVGPNAFIADGFNVKLFQPGAYFIEVEGTNGCRNTDTIGIPAANGFPDYVIVNDSISCIKTSATIGIVMPGADEYEWINYSGPDSKDAFIQVFTPAKYLVMATDTDTHCSIKALATVFSDLLPPPFNFQSDVITCSDPIATISFLPIAGQVYTDVHWEFPDMTTDTSLVINVVDPDYYLLSATGENGCTGSIGVKVDIDTVPPIFFLESDSLGCDHNGVIENIRVDSLISISWNGPGLFTSSMLSPAISDTGLYIANGVGENGCISQVSIFVNGDFIPPVNILSLDTLTCNSLFAVISASSQDSVISFEWKDSFGNIISTIDSVSIPDTGSYTVALEGLNHCKSFDSFHLDPPVYPIILYTVDTINCSSTSLPIVATSNVNSPSFIWLNLDGDILGSTNQLTVDSTGPFVISITGTNGCETLDTLLVPIDTISPVTNIELIGEVRCKIRDVMFDGSASIPNNVQFFWTTLGGSIIGSNTIPIIEARDTGVYVLKITDPGNGCSDEDSFHLMENPDAISMAFLEINSPECSGDSNASIRILGLSGGIQPLLYELDGSGLQDDSLFTGLKPGDHLLQIVDAGGCEYDTTVLISPTNSFTIDAGPDQEIYLGESADVSGTSSLPSDEILLQEWDSIGITLCQDCNVFSVSPPKTTTYRYKLISKTGCVLEDDVIIYVIEKGKYFIPNIFSPNGDNKNEEVRLYTSPGIVKVKKWIIFDRWGNAVFGKTDFEPGDPSVFWNGRTSLGGILNPGVFPYMLEVELSNGIVELYRGTITLLR